MVKIRAALALVVLGLFPFVVIALLVAVVAAARWAFVTGSNLAGSKILLYLGLPLLFAVFIAVRDVARARPTPSSLPELKREAHPALWREVDALADGLNTPSPSRIVLAPEVNAAVREVRAEREMTIGLPLLVGLTVAQLRAVLGHELGHYGAGHTRLLRLTYRATDILLGTVRNSSGVLRWVLTPYAGAYLFLAAAANRAQEDQADAYAARVAGPRVAADAMRRVIALDAAWDALISEYLPLAEMAGRRPRLSEGLQDLLRARAQEIEEFVTWTETSLAPSAGDSHPPLGQRIARFEALAATSGREGPSSGEEGRLSGWTLLSGGWRSVSEMEQQLLQDRTDDASWPEVVRLAGAEVCALTAGELVRAAQETAAARPTLSGFLDALEAGSGSRLVAPLVNPALSAGDRPDAERSVLTELLSAVVVDSLIATGRAHHRIDWSALWEVVVTTSDGEERLDAEALVRDAVTSPSAVPALRTRLLALGAAFEHTTAPTAAGEPEPVGLISRARDKRAEEKTRKVIDILVCDSGLLVVPSPRRPMLSGALRELSGKSVIHRADELVSVSHAERVRTPGARWIDTDNIRAARLKRRPWGWTLRIRLVDDEELVMRSTHETGDHGAAYEGLGELFGSRMGAPL